jgi:hypothetical protein
LGLKKITLDQLFWNPNWEETPRNEFHKKVAEELASPSERGWVADGNYETRLSGLIDEQATDIICQSSRAFEVAYLDA